MEQHLKVVKITLLLASAIVALMGIVYAYDVVFHLNLSRYGILPRNAKGLIGILTGPFIHSTNGYQHLLNNSIPMFVLTWLLFYNFRDTAPKIFIFTYFFTGLLVWIFGRENYHIGMSGVIYGLASFLMISGFLTKHLRVAAISLLVVFLYGSLIWGIFPHDPRISFEGHFFGFFVGALLAILYRKRLPQPQKFNYEIEEELGLENYESEYWNTNSTDNSYHQSTENKTSADPLRVIYHFKPISGSKDDNEFEEE